MLNPITPEDQRILAWFEAQSEETLRDLSDRFDAGSPREFWTAFLADCTPPAQECPGDSLAAPAEAGQVVCNQIFGGYSATSVDHLDAQCTSCMWFGPLWMAECFAPNPPAVVLGCPVCASALVLLSSPESQKAAA